MIKNYLTIAWRNLLRHKTFSFINIAGLAIGIAACIIIFLYVHHELSFDQYNTKVDRIIRIAATVHAPESDIVMATAPKPLADVLKRGYPEVEATVRLEQMHQVVKFNNESYREDAFYGADSSVFSVFSFDFLEGTPVTALQNPHSIVLTKTIAEKYFGKEPALGKTIVCNEQNLMVTAVVKDRPANSDMEITALLSAEFSKSIDWLDFDGYTFVLFRSKPNLKNFARQLTDISKRYVQPALNTIGAINYRMLFSAEPLSEVHFITGKVVDTPKGNRQFSYVFSILAVFILIIALLNYINLSTAKSFERAKEVGIRKVSGAGRFQLLRQFLFESFFLISIAWVLAITFVRISLPFINQLLQTTIVINWIHIVLFTGAIFLVTLILAGLYPAFVLSSFLPVKVLKGNWRNSVKGVFLRKTVTITQFAIAAALIMGTTVIYNQMKFIRQKDLGYNKEQLLAVYLPGDSVSRHTVSAFQDALRKRPEVKDMTVGNRITEQGLSMATTFAEAEGKKRELMCNYYFIDPHFLPVFQIKLKEGRNLSDSFSTDKKEGFLVNEAFVKMMGWKSAIGKSMEGFEHKGKVVGVVKNFYYKSLHNLVEPLVLICNTPVNDYTTTIKIQARDLPLVTATFKQYFPSLPIDYAFFDDIVNKRYEKDRITMSLFNVFTVLAIFVSCLGLYGLVALIAAQRTKEIGIRKVLGAELGQLLSVMSKDFLRLICFALIIALPIAGIVMNKWLSSYAYHIYLSWWMFLVPVLLVLLIAMLVISREIIRTATANPVKSLRME